LKETIMRINRVFTIALALSTTLGSAFAQSTVSRAQVRAELVQAEKNGDVPAGETGHTLAELYPSRYPHAPAAPGLTRGQVKAELAEATRNGDVQVGDSGYTLAELNPSRYPRPQTPGLTRAQVKAELLQAIRDGDVKEGDGDHPLAERFPQRYAAARARDGEARIVQQ
jgi:hypothetical protein